MKISAAVLTFNSESTIEKTLESVAFLDEIIVVDSGSSDSTLSICERYTNKIFRRAWSGYADQKKFAIDQCSNDWIFVLDSDEEASPALSSWLRGFDESRTKFDGFAFKRVMFIGGKRWDVVWRNEYRLRLFRKDRYRILVNEPHERIIVDGKCTRLDLEIYHYSYSSLKDQVTKLNNHAYTWAKNCLPRSNFAVLINLFVSPVARFVKLFFLKFGFLKGVTGYIVCKNEAYYSFLKYSYLYERLTIKSEK
ncbi:MAG: glycosyltransferase family 2 protein [Thermoplasmatales archaeon]